jgi:hypothetical protein
MTCPPKEKSSSTSPLVEASAADADPAMMGRGYQNVSFEEG